MSISGIIGVGWPWKIYPEFTDSNDAIADSITDILTTALNERKMNNAFGSEVNKIVFENRGEVLSTLARREITVALGQHLPSVEILSIEITEPDRDIDPVTVNIIYRYVGIVGTVAVPMETV